MDALMFILAVALVGASARLAVRGVVVPRLRLKTHLREISDYGFATHYEDVDVALRERLRGGLRSAARRLGHWMAASIPSLSPLSRSKLNAAGYFNAEPDLVHGYRALAAIGLPLFFLALFVLSGKAGALAVLVVVIMALAGWMGPSAYVNRRGASRLAEIDHSLPEVIDLLIATVEAGMGFVAALGLVAERFHGPLGDELRLTIRQQSLGMSIATALEEMVGRCETPSVRAFARTAVRGESLGISIGPVLRELSVDQRSRHRMAAREKMQKAPIKLIFPLMFLIMPALFIVLFYPAFIGIKAAFHGVL
jgi:tight adherence protein C